VAQFEVLTRTPPPRSLGTHKFPKNTHCGDTIELRNKYFVVSANNSSYLSSPSLCEGVYVLCTACVCVLCVYMCARCQGGCVCAVFKRKQG